MPRRPRVLVPGVPHHVTQRGNNRQAVFYSAEDRRLYLEFLARHSPRGGRHLRGYCLMTNHVHLIVVPDSEQALARTLARTHAEYAQTVNQVQHRSGHLWQNRFFSCPLDGAHLQSALLYVDLNPVRAGLAALPWDWPWSSAAGAPHGRRPADRSFLSHRGCGRDQCAIDPVLDTAWVDRAGGRDFAG